MRRGVAITGKLYTDAELEGVVMGFALASRSQFLTPSLRRHLPPLYSGKIRYQQEDVGSEFWQTALQTAELGTGDCEDLVIYRLAELWCIHGEPGAHARVLTISPRLRHVVVRRADGGLEDPSAALGMHHKGNFSRPIVRHA